MDLTEEQERDKLLFELIKRRLDNEGQRTNDLDNKASNLIGFTSVVVGILLGAGTFKLSSLLSAPGLSVLYFIGIGILLLSVVLALGGFKVRSWSDVPDVLYVIKEYTKLRYDEVLQRNAGEMAKVVSDSENKNNRKAHLINYSWYFLIAGLSLVFIFVIAFIAAGAGISTND